MNNNKDMMEKLEAIRDDNRETFMEIKSDIEIARKTLETINENMEAYLEIYMLLENNTRRK